MSAQLVVRMYGQGLLLPYSYWLDWLAFRDVLNAACNITSAVYKGVGGCEG